MSGGLTFEVFTLFPAAITGFLREGLIGKALDRGLVTVHCTDYRDFTHDRHRTVDDTPYGGGAGMVIKIEPVVAALDAVTMARGPMHRILVTPSARRMVQADAERLAALPRVAILCGRYEGIDDRVREAYVDESLSLGDFVLNGGEVAALAIIEAVARLKEGVLGNPESIAGESFAPAEAGPWLEHPHYTRPENFRGLAVPGVLLGGDHQAIARWRAERACRRTWALRPDLRRPRSLEGPLYLGFITGRQVTNAGEDRLRSLGVAAGIPRIWIGGGRSDGAAGAVNDAADRDGGDLHVRDFKELRRHLRRRHGHPPHCVALVTPEEGDPEVVEHPGLLIDLLALRRSFAEKSGREDARGIAEPAVVLLLGARGDLLKKCDARYAPSLGSGPSRGLELALDGEMIESSQPDCPGGEALVAAALRDLSRGRIRGVLPA